MDNSEKILLLLMGLVGQHPSVFNPHTRRKVCAYCHIEVAPAGYKARGMYHADDCIWQMARTYLEQGGYISNEKGS